MTSDRKEGNHPMGWGKEARVLFLCTGNYYRSRLAEELLRYSAKDSDLGVECDSAGLGNIPNPSNPGPIGMGALQYLQARGVHSRSLARYPKKCTPSDIEAADIIVCMNEGEHRATFENQARALLSYKRVVYWHVPDVEGDPLLIGPRLIEAEVRDLLAKLKER